MEYGIEFNTDLNTNFKTLEGRDLDDIVNLIKKYERIGYEIYSDIKRMNGETNKWFVCMRKH